MLIRSINPATGEPGEVYPAWDDDRLEQAVARADAAARAWSARPLDERIAVVLRLAQILRARRDELAALTTREMGKLVVEARAEIGKCAQLCDYYAEAAPAQLGDETVAADSDGRRILYQPLGLVLAVMPWNFPFWQVLRASVPALLAGNGMLLKHAPNVPGCALALEALWSEAGAAPGLFVNLQIEAERVEELVADPRLRAVTLTGSERAGRAVAAAAGRHLKKSVLELGGSDPFVVLEDADLDRAAAVGVRARFLNAGQSCIAAKRFVLVEQIAEPFLQRFRAAVEQLHPGDPLDERSTLAPMARADLRDQLHAQVVDALERGATCVTGCEPLPGAGFFYRPSILDGVPATARAYREELFGPVATVLRAADEQDALRLANDSPYGLGGSVWTADARRGEDFARRLECGCAFVNSMVKSDPRLPFGGVKTSGYGRELATVGIREFVNVKTLWVD